MRILAIDQASNCGWCLNYDTYGTWDLTTRKDESGGMKWLRFEAKLSEIHKITPLDLIVYERPAGAHQNTVIHSAKMVSIIERFCEANSIAYRSFSANEIKKHATGKGNAGKPLMVKAAQERFGMIGDDDNQADALWLYDLARKELNL